MAAGRKQEWVWQASKLLRGYSRVQELLECAGSITTPIIVENNLLLLSTERSPKTKLNPEWPFGAHLDGLLDVHITVEVLRIDVVGRLLLRPVPIELEELCAPPPLHLEGKARERKGKQFPLFDSSPVAGPGLGLGALPAAWN